MIQCSKALSDQQLTNYILHHKYEYFEQIYLRYKDKIYSYIRNILNYNQQEAIEITSEVFLKVFEYCKQKPIENIKSLLYKIAHNESINWIQKNQKHTFIDEQQYQEIPEDDNLKEDIDKTYQQNNLQQCLQGIDEKYREVLYLYYFEQKDYNEIADILGTNKNTVGTLISRAKQQIKMQANKCGFEFD